MSRNNCRQMMRDPKIGGAVAGAGLLLALLMVYFSSSGGDGDPVYNKLYCFDLATKKLFTAATDNSIPPIPAPSGQLINGEAAGVRAFVFTCEPACGDESKHFVGYLMKFSPELKKAIDEKQPAETINTLRYTSTFISGDEGATWHVDGTPEAEAAKTKPRERCPAPVGPCLPN